MTSRILTSALILTLLAFCIGLISCDKSTNPVPIPVYELTVSAHPDSIPNTGSVSTIHAIVIDMLDSTQQGGYSLEFSATEGNMTGIAVSSATDPTGIVPPYVYFSCQSCPDTLTEVIVTGTAYMDGSYIDEDTTRIVVYAP